MLGRMYVQVFADISTLEVLLLESIHFCHFSLDKNDVHIWYHQSITSTY